MSNPENLIDDLVTQLENIPTARRIEIPSTSNLRTNTTRMAQPTIKDYLDTIPSFNGDPILISNFILACENVLDTLGRANDNVFNSFLMAHIRNKLVGRAAQLISVRNLRTWPELKEAIVFTFGDQRDEDALVRDLIIMKQEINETALKFGERCQDIVSHLLSRVNSTNSNEALKTEKIRMYKNLAVKTFTKGVREPYSLIVRCRNPSTLEEAINIISEENNLNYIKRMNGTTNQPPIRNPHPTFQPFRARQNSPMFNTRPMPPRPNFNTPNRPFQWPSRPIFWRPQAQNNYIPQQNSSNVFRTQQQQQKPTPPTRMQNTSQSQRRSINYPIPMDTSSGNTVIHRQPNLNYQELHYTDVNQENEYLPEEYYYESNASYSQPYDSYYYEPTTENFNNQYPENCDPNPPIYEAQIQQAVVQEQKNPTCTETQPEEQDFQEAPSRNTTK